MCQDPNRVDTSNNFLSGNYLIFPLEGERYRITFFHLYWRWIDDAVVEEIKELGSHGIIKETSVKAQIMITGTEDLNMDQYLVYGGVASHLVKDPSASSGVRLHINYKDEF